MLFDRNHYECLTKLSIVKIFSILDSIVFHFNFKFKRKDKIFYLKNESEHRLVLFKKYISLTMTTFFFIISHSKRLFFFTLKNKQLKKYLFKVPSRTDFPSKNFFIPKCLLNSYYLKKYIPYTNIEKKIFTRRNFSFTLNLRVITKER